MFSKISQMLFWQRNVLYECLAVKASGASEEEVASVVPISPVYKTKINYAFTDGVHDTIACDIPRPVVLAQSFDGHFDT